VTSDRGSAALARLGESKTTYGALVEKTDWKAPLRRLGVGGRIILNWI